MSITNNLLRGLRWGSLALARPLALVVWATPVAAQQRSPDTQASPPARAEFANQAASDDTRRLANWVAASGDNRGLPFVIIDKVSARVFVFDVHARLRGAAPALLGLARGDTEVAGIGERKLATITPAERITPAGRFEAALGRDFKQDILWIDYGTALSMHRVIAGKPSDRRHARLVSPTSLDNRITFGCVNVPASFYDSTIVPTFKGTVGIVYILPETRRLETVFTMDAPSAIVSRNPTSIR